MRVSNTVLGLGQIIFAIAMFLYSQTFPNLRDGFPGPSLFPSVLAVLFIIAGLTLVAQGIRSGEKIWKFDTSDISSSGKINILMVLAVILLYIFFSDLLGFQIISVILLFGLMKWLDVSTKWSLIMSSGVTFGIYILFAKVLLVPLPWGLWGW